MLKLSLKEGEYVNIGDNIRVVYAGGSGKNGRLMIDAPREMNISRSSMIALSPTLMEKCCLNHLPLLTT